MISDIRDLKSKNIDIKWSAINNLKNYLHSHPPTDFRSRMIIKSLLGMIKDPDAKIREAVLLTLMEGIPEVEKVEPLILNAFTDSSSGIRSIALEWFNNQNHKELRDYTVKALHDEGEVVRKTALEIVVKHQIKGVEKELLQLLKTEGGGLRRSVIYALGKLKTAQAVSTLIEIMRNPNYDDWTRNQASSALDHMGGDEILTPFIENLADLNDYVRETAASFLKKNENELISKILSTSRLDYLALLHYATETTRQNFDSAVNSLTNQLTLAIEDLRSNLISKDIIVFSELVNELNSTDVVVKALIDKVLSLKLIQLSNDEFLTETGLKNALIKKLEENTTIYIPALQQISPYNKIETEPLIQKIESIDFSQKISNDFFITKPVYARIIEEFEKEGLVNLLKIAENIHQSVEIVKNIIIPSIGSTEDGWFNSREQFLSQNYVKKQISKELDIHSIISLKKLLDQIGNPKIDKQTLVNLVEDSNQGKWLEMIDVFLDIKIFQELEKDAAGIDESRVSDLLSAINIDFNTFLQNLQSIMDIKSFRTKDGHMISLESLHGALQQNIIGKGYIILNEFLKSMKLDKDIETNKPIIMEYITQEFSGRTDPEVNFFITEELISNISKEVETKPRLNFSVIGFKLNLDPDILSHVIRQILFIRGFTNKVGEFVTQDGISQEIAGIMEYRQEFSFTELFEILEIINEKKNILIVRELVAEDENLLISKDNEIVISQKMAISTIMSFLKNPLQQMKEIIPIEEISIELKIPSQNIKNILNSLIQNNLIDGSLDKKKKNYRP